MVFDTVIGCRHKHAKASLVGRGSGYSAMAKAIHKMAGLIGQAIIKALTPFATRVKKLHTTAFMCTADVH